MKLAMELCEIAKSYMPLHHHLSELIDRYNRIESELGAAMAGV